MTYWKSQKIDVSRYLLINKELIALIILSCIIAVFFVFEGFATGDSIRYALGLQNITQKGITQITHVFNGEMCSGYYLLLYLLAKLMGDYVSLSGLMNNLNAVTSVVLQCSLFLFFNSLFSNKKLSFFACLTVLLSPSIWFLSHYGNPGLLSLSLFISSMFIFDKIARKNPEDQHSGFLWFFFVILSTSSVIIRLDIVLAFGAYFGLLFYRQALSISNFFKTLSILIIGLFFLLGVRYFVLGYLINPSGGTFFHHIATRLEPEFVIRNIVKNCTLWALSTNALIFFIAVFGFISLRPTSKLGVLLVSWIAPWSIFLVFRGMDLGRIIAPSIPIVSLVAVIYVGSIFKKRQVLALSLMLILAQVTALGISYPLIKVYPFKKIIDGRILAAFPLGFLPVDHYYRQRAIIAHEHIARLVTSEQDVNVMIVGGSGLMYYKFYLSQYRNMLSNKNHQFTYNGVILERYITTENEFYIFNLNHNWLIKNPIRRAIGYVNNNRTKIHFVPFWKEYPMAEGEIFLTKKTIQSVLDHEAAVMEVRKKMIHQ